jgi:hypothetical protein
VTRNVEDSKLYAWVGTLKIDSTYWCVLYYNLIPSFTYIIMSSEK